MRVRQEFVLKWKKLSRVGMFYNFADLLSMAFLVVGDEILPLVEIQIAEKRMRCAVNAEIPIAICFQKVSRQFSRGGERRDELVFVSDEFGLRMDGRFHAEQAPGRNPNWKMQTLMQRH